MTPQPGFVPHVAELGQGPRKALALHCTLAFSGAWKGVAARIGDRLTLIAPDMPSHGQSADWDGHSSFGDTVFAASLSCLTEPMDVIGHSFGGVTALRLAVERPDLVRSLTMVEPVFFHVGFLENPSTRAGHDTPMGEVMGHCAEGRFEEAARLFNRQWSDAGPRWPQMPEQVRQAMTRAIHVVPSTVDLLCDDSANLMARLDRVAMPSLLIHGATSPELVKATNSGLARRLPNANQVEIAGAGHMAPISHPAEVVAAWSALLGRGGAMAAS
ncbi:alpha/beta hydrolase [Aliishimia ponticola]|uniref:Alpha/beta hydrolase n=1 Tax=Aliishimia ponticola TaxID=2499833 RepID=A0A4S4NC49_9RHOB|nr:alpha/beta hydrolase [Aliishimia ponticola]THH36982.1 alpha/beta hydrolase [Aliishimia ponticola]